MRRLAAETGVPVSFSLVQIDSAPTLWRELMDESLRALDAGAPCTRRSRPARSGC